ncbi:MAG: hypothetical protein ACIAQZ_16040 [Sedimentisphaeraceae bacterium JB056]
MKLRNIFIILLCVLMSAAFLISGSMQLDDINAARKELKLVSNEPLENAPPALAFATVAMGAFRGLVVDILWMRADKLKEEGQFFDAKQLAEWITVLQPRFAAVWDFQAWNMAYNISVAMPNTQPAERWKWVQNGYELLRDKGIVQNPNSIILYRSLAWIFQHKIGGVTDDNHKYYKLQIALAVNPLVEPLTNEHFDQLAASPKTFEEIMQDPKIAEYVNKLKASDKENFTDETEFVKTYLTLIFSQGQGFSEEANLTVADYIETDVFEKFHTFAQAWELRNTWKFDIDRMIQLNKKYGPVSIDENTKLPLNWGHPQTHAIYWAELGLDIAGNKGEYSIDEVNTDRIVFHSLQALYRNGKEVIYDVPMKMPDTQKQQGNLDTDTEPEVIVAKTLYTLPDLRMFDSYNAAQLERIRKYSRFADSNLRPLMNGHRNMLNNAILSFYMAGHVKKAAEVYKELRNLYPRKENSYPLKEFCRRRMQEEFQGFAIDDAKEMILMMLRESYFRYAVGEDGESKGREDMARQAYDYYLRDYGEDEIDRVNLPEFGRLRYMALIGFLNDEYFPLNMRQALLGRIQNERPELFDRLDKERQRLLKEQEALDKQQGQN